MPEDAAEIDSWDDWDANYVWQEICKAVYWHIGGLSAGVCPWCVFYEMRCNECSYAKRHGKCGNYRSDWFKIIIELGGDPFTSHCEGLFPVSWYRQIIDYIEKC